MDTPSSSFYLFLGPLYLILFPNTSVGSEKRSTQISQFASFQSLLGTGWEDEEVATNGFLNSRVEALSVHAELSGYFLLTIRGQSAGPYL